MKPTRAKLLTELTAKDLPVIVFKYRSWEDVHGKNLLLNSEIFMAPPSSFDDPAEFNLPRRFDLVTPELLYKKAYNEAKRQQPQAGPAQTKLLTSRLLKEMKFYDQNNRIKTRDQTKKKIDAIVGVFCCSRSNNNSKMWDTWGSFFTGYCVGFDPYKLITSAKIWSYSGNVDYYDPANPPIILPIKENDNDYLDDALTEAFSLPNTWPFENEYRIVKINIGERKKYFSSESIKEVILGEDMPLDNQKEIISIVQSRFTAAKLYRTQFNSTTNETIIIPIS